MISRPTEKNTTKPNIKIFHEYINNKYKSIPSTIIKNDIGEIKYLPPISKEWRNSVYFFNKNSIKNLPSYDIQINYLINGYFKLYFNKKIIKYPFRSMRARRRSINKVYLSNAEIKHTNIKVNLTLYAYNREKKSLLKKILKLRGLSFSRIKEKIILLLNKRRKFFGNVSINLYIKLIKILFYREFKLYRRYKLKLNLSKSKFEEYLLYNLISLISKLYNKKVEFNFVNIKSIILNSDLFTKILVVKLRKKRRMPNIQRLMSFVVNRAVIPKVNRVIERGRPKVKSINSNLLENKYKNNNLNYNIQKNYLDNLLNEIYYNVNINNNDLELVPLHTPKNYIKIYEIIFNSIKYKNMGGVKLEMSGRLTKRYRADRAVSSVRRKGGLNNKDSSYKGLSSVVKRGYMNSNVEYSIFTSKRRIGAYAVKGWISGK